MEFFPTPSNLFTDEISAEIGKVAEERLLLSCRKPAKLSSEKEEKSVMGWCGSGYSEVLVLSGNSFQLDAALGENTAIQFIVSIAVRLCVLMESLCLWDDTGPPCTLASSQSLSQQE